jgi:hypothetical protein
MTDAALNERYPNLELTAPGAENSKKSKGASGSKLKAPGGK